LARCAASIPACRAASTCTSATAGWWSSATRRSCRTTAEGPVPQAKNLRAVSDRIEALLAEVRALGEPRARETAEELVRLLMELYGAGIERLLEIVDEAGAGELFDRFVQDDLVASLMILHGLHPQDIES